MLDGVCNPVPRARGQRLRLYAGRGLQPRPPRAGATFKTTTKIIALSEIVAGSVQTPSSTEIAPPNVISELLNEKRA
jgi:hypothetical protein